ncbi:DUF6125 family protein [Chloroflexota bacterium]
MLEIGELNKDDVYEVMREVLYSLNYMWFQFEEWVKTNCPKEFESEGFQVLYRNFGSYQAKRLSRALAISGEGVDALVQLLKHSHWAVFENIEITKLEGKRIRMRTIDCSTQAAVKRWGMDYYECGAVASVMRNGFFQQANQNSKIQRIFTPPETRPEGTPENVSCEWLISIEEG